MRFQYKRLLITGWLHRLTSHQELADRKSSLVTVETRKPDHNSPILYPRLFLKIMKENSCHSSLSGTLRYTWVTIPNH